MNKMSKECAQKMKTFKNYCTCDGYAHSMNGRDKRRPHMDYCPQREEYNQWYDALYGTNEQWN